ncbi:hypothetical protein [Microbacterium sp.]|uniref:hypothetical protein n=1 Tax=Microbacterium sp. TaxID=51671 RepID=UPI0028976503|nr:hypothetical protein [Microbacterium sp.]
MGVLRDFLGNKKASGLRFGTTLAIGALIASGLVLAPAAASADTAPVEATVPATVSTDVLPTVQVNGIVWDQVIVGNTVYAAGQFATARPAGAAVGVNEVARNNVIAYDIRTGAMTSFAPNVNGQVRSIAASPDGKRLYIGGDFTAVNGSTRNRVAAFDIPAGTLVGSWAPSVNASVRAITATNSAVYFTGIFGRVASNDRVRAAAVSSTGALLPWAPQLDNRGNDVVVSGDGTKVALAGHFTTVNGSSNPGYGMALVDATTGGLLPFAANSIVRNGGADAAIWSLTTDGDNLYGTGYHFGAGGNLEGIFKSDWATGGLTWVEDCHGDTYSAYHPVRPRIRLLRLGRKPRTATAALVPHVQHGVGERREPGPVERDRQRRLRDHGRRVHPGEQPAPAGSRALRDHREGAELRRPASEQQHLGARGELDRPADDAHQLAAELGPRQRVPRIQADQGRRQRLSDLHRDRPIEVGRLGSSRHVVHRQGAGAGQHTHISDQSRRPARQRGVEQHHHRDGRRLRRHAGLFDDSAR